MCSDFVRSVENGPKRGFSEYEGNHNVMYRGAMSESDVGARNRISTKISRRLAPPHPSKRTHSRGRRVMGARAASARRYGFFLKRTSKR